jgi:hypothetical protein
MGALFVPMGALFVPMGCHCLPLTWPLTTAPSACSADEQGPARGLPPARSACSKPVYTQADAVSPVYVSPGLARSAGRASHARSGNGQGRWVARAWLGPAAAAAFHWPCREQDPAQASAARLQGSPVCRALSTGSVPCALIEGPKLRPGHGSRP